MRVHVSPAAAALPHCDRDSMPLATTRRDVMLRAIRMLCYVLDSHADDEHNVRKATAFLMRPGKYEGTAVDAGRLQQACAKPRCPVRLPALVCPPLQANLPPKPLQLHHHRHLRRQ